MKSRCRILAFVVALLLVASQSLYTVDQRKYAIKFQLGEIVETKTEAGLYFKVPLLQNVQVLRQGILTLDNPEPDRMTTSEKKPLLVDFIVLWRIIDVQAVLRLGAGRRGGGAPAPRADRAREPRRGIQQARRARRRSPPSATRSRQTRSEKANADAKSIGVEIVDVRLRRVELPPDVTGPVYQRMESERRRVANELRSLGGAESEKIRADADRQRQVILADAYRQAQKIKGEGDAKASAIYAAGLRRRIPSSTRSIAASRPTRRRSAARAT